MSTMWQSHLWTVMRAAEFFKWIESGEYYNVLNRVKPIEKLCKRCGTKLNDSQLFCTRCGEKA